MNTKYAKQAQHSLAGANAFGPLDQRIYRIVYSSRADHSMTAEEALMIFRRSQTNNENQGLTGCLTFAEGKFAQILEGPRAQCEDTFKSIAADRRHTAVEVHFADFVEERSFDSFVLNKDESPERLVTSPLWCRNAQ
jgi:hypothetical protein